MEKKWLVITSMVLSINLISPVLAGVHGGNGGGAFICSIDPTKSIFLDLYEAQEAVKDGGLGVTIPKNDNDADTQIKEAFEKLNPKTTLFVEMLAIYSEVQNARPEPVPPNRQLAWPSDEHNKYAPDGCYKGDDQTIKYPYIPKGIILYHDAHSEVGNDAPADWMDIDRDTLNALPSQQQAAAWVHETVYKFRRKHYHDDDSVIARKIVGLLFSDLTGDALNSALIPYAMSPKTGASHLGSDSSSTGFHAAKYYKSYSSELTPQIRYRLFLKDNPSRDKRCKTPEKLQVPTEGTLPSDGELTNRMGNDPSVKCLEGTNSCVSYGMPQGEGTIFLIKNLGQLFFQPTAFFNAKAAYCPFTMEISDPNDIKVTMDLSYQDLYGVNPVDSKALSFMRQSDPLDIRAQNPNLDMNNIPFGKIDLTRQFYAINLYEDVLTP